MQTNFREKRTVLRGLWLMGLGIASIIGITLQVTSVVEALVDAGFRPLQVGWGGAAQLAALCGWVMIGIAAYRGWRFGVMPRPWFVMAIVVVGWVALLLNRAG